MTQGGGRGVWKVRTGGCEREMEDGGWETRISIPRDLIHVTNFLLD